MLEILQMTSLLTLDKLIWCDKYHGRYHALFLIYFQSFEMYRRQNTSTMHSKIVPNVS